MFEYLAANYPASLLALVRSGRLAPGDLTFAAEIAGSIPDSQAVRSALTPLLDHPDPAVREGAIYGLARHLDDQTRMRLRHMVTSDPSPAVRTDAGDVLDF